MEGNTEIEHVLRPTFFLDCMQHKVVSMFRDNHLVPSSRVKMSKKKTVLIADGLHTLDVLEELTVTELMAWQLIFRGDRFV
jgi:hypothetical protein